MFELHASILSGCAQPRYFNLYGPTETNVCTYFEVPATIAIDRAEPYPIGKTLFGHQRDSAQPDFGAAGLVISSPNNHTYRIVGDSLSLGGLS